MCVRREAIQQAGLFDECYQMYVEEIDWSWRVAAAGWEVYCVPGAEIVHFGGQSTGQVQTPSLIHLWTSRYQFYRQHYRPLKVWLAAQLVRVGMRRKAAHDARAAGRGELTPAELAKRLASYEKVIAIWQGR
jgi:GT2 family glycosyltransferase